MNQLANYALVEWPDNIEISDKAPAEYFPKYVERYKRKDGADLQRMYYWHALPDGWENLEYETSST